MNSLEIIIITLLAVGALLVWYYIVFILKEPVKIEKNSRLPDTAIFPVDEWEDITAHELGEIEKNIKGLIRVIVAAHRVEEPSNALRQAVKQNLKNNIEYHFLVSQEHAQSELDGWVLMFLAIAKVVLTKAGSRRTPQSLVRISNLKYPWRDTPYVFYQTKTSNGQLATVAFRGNEIDEGIADKYTRLPGWMAYSLANAILSDAPEPMTIEAPQFELPPEINPDVLTKIGPREEIHATSSY